MTRSDSGSMRWRSAPSGVRPVCHQERTHKGMVCFRRNVHRLRSACLSGMFTTASVRRIVRARLTQVVPIQACDCAS
eukprot:1896494-Pleurochrysis_carterae.AAC.1